MQKDLTTLLLEQQAVTSSVTKVDMAVDQLKLDSHGIDQEVSTLMEANSSPTITTSQKQKNEEDLQRLHYEQREVRMMLNDRKSQQNSLKIKEVAYQQAIQALLQNSTPQERKPIAAAAPPAGVTPSPMQIPARPPGVPQGSQISQLPEFDGKFGPEAETWLKQVDRFKEQFNWSDQATANIARNKLVGKARLFVDNQEKALILGLDRWSYFDGHIKPLRTQMLEKYTLPTTAQAATIALQELKQHNDDVDLFYERVRYACDKFMYAIPKGTEAEKIAYREMFNQHLLVFFKAGLRPEYLKQIFSSTNQNQPKTAQELYEAAKNTERASGHGHKEVYTTKDLYSVELLPATPTQPNTIAEPPKATSSEAELSMREMFEMTREMYQSMCALSKNRGDRNGTRRYRSPS